MFVWFQVSFSPPDVVDLVSGTRVVLLGDGFGYFYFQPLLGDDWTP